MVCSPQYPKGFFGDILVFGLQQVDYTHWKTIDLPEERTGEVKFRGVKAESAEPIKTRYVKVEVTGTKECPTWHYGVGHPSWFFIDEVIIK